MTRVIRRLLPALAISFAALALVVPATSAHPLGNFTINHYNGLRVAADGVTIDHVTDFAEIPTFSERQAMDTDGDGTVSEAESAAYGEARCRALPADISLMVDGRPVPLLVTHTGLSFAMGQGSQIMRLVCVYDADAEIAPGGGTYEFSDSSYAERRGWREIVIEGDATQIHGTDLPSTSTSQRLTSYPDNLLALPLNQASARFDVVPGGPSLPAPGYPDAHPVSTAIDSPAAADQPAPAVPAGTNDLGQEVTALFQAPDLTPPIILLSLAVAVALGAAHALSPGHGKTVMAAYLVGSRGTTRQAVGLGLTVTVSHTLGVLALGALSLSASALIPPERLYPILGVVSGAIVIVIGAYLLIQRVRVMRATRGRGDHDHEHGHGHEREHQHAHPPGWHEHDGIGHTHLPEQGMGKRGLFALGLSGGMVPSISALLILLGSISIGRPAYGIVLTAAFGLGMALVLVGIGLALVYARNWVERVPARGLNLRLGERLPLVTACVVLVAGVLITGQALTAFI
jgi:ABC-type nickel/cobalt efflux system permease component RcnA